MTDRERVALVILDQISLFTALLDTNGRVLEVNRAALERSGLDRENVLGRPFPNLGCLASGQSAAAWFRNAIRRAAAGEPVHGNIMIGVAGGSGELEFSLTPVLEDSGRVEYVLVEGRDLAPAEHGRAEPSREPEDRAKPRGAQPTPLAEALAEDEIRDETGRATGRVGTTTDIDDLKRAQEALRGQARWLETVLESVSDGLIATGADGHIRLINSAAQTLTGWKMRDAVGRPLEEVFRIVDVSTRSPLECPGVTVLREGRVVELANHAVLLARDGTERPITDGGAPIRDEYGSILGGVLCFHDVSLRRQAELAVARLAAIVEYSDDAIIGEDLDGHIISWNEGARRIYGYTHEEVIGRSSTLLVPPDRFDEIASVTAPIWRGERVSNLETVRLRKDGSAVDVSIAVSPIRDGHDQLIGVSEIARDISERKRVEVALGAREDHLRLALEAAHMAAWDHDIATNRVTLSVSDKSIFGDEPGVYEWVDLRRRIHPEDLEPTEREVERMRRELAPYSRELRFILPDGSIRWVSNQGRFLCDDSGEAVRMLGVTLDITERKRAEDALRASERRYSLLFETMAPGVVFQDADGTIIDLNPAAERILTTNSVEIIGQTSVDREPYCVRADGSPFPGLEHPAMVALKTGQILRNVLMGIYDPTGGNTRWIDITAVPLHRDKEDRPYQVCTLFDDITDRKRAEDALRAREDQLRLALEAAHMSAWDHDLTTDRITLSVSDKSLFGDEPGTYNYQELNQRIHPDDREEYVRARRERAPISREARFVRPDGSIRWVWTQGRFIHNEAGQAVRALGVTLDITERKRAEDELRRYATRLVSLHEIDRAVLAIQPPEKIARVALRYLAKLVPCWRASVARIDPGANEGRILTSIGALSRRTAQGATSTLTVIEPEDLETLKRGKSIIVDDLDTLTSMSEPLKLLQDAGARSVARLPLLVRGRLIGSINLYSDRREAYTAENVEVIREAADQVAIALHNVRLYEENRVARERLEVLSRRLIRAQEDERRRISRELHDEIGQALTAVKVNLQSVKNEAGGQDDRVAECIAIVDDTLGRVRGMALDLRPSLLDDLGLGAALQWYVERHARRTGLAGRLIADPEKLRAAPEIETACFRVVQEALTNIARHARATRFSVELLQHNGGLELIIRDDGCGFDPAEALGRALGGASLGLVGMIERIELIGGKVVFVSAPGKGTEVQASISRIMPASPAEQDPGSGL